MFLHPLSEALGYAAPDGKGVYLFPFSKQAPNGWGEPRRDAESGAPIVPGTVGGPLASTLIWKKGGAFKPSSTKFFQKAGVISWWGDWRNSAKQAKGKQVLSYAGPKLRYFREEGFNYGDSPEHEEIYYLGSYAAVAPGPVSGACLRKMNYYDPVKDKTQEGTFIFAVVSKKDKDEFYRKLWNFSVVPAHKMNDIIRSAQKKLYDAKLRPMGWEKIGEYVKPSDDHYPTETPWFFNKTGTEAVHMRRKKMKFNNGHQDVEEDFFDRIKLTVQESSATAVSLGNLPPMNYEEKVTKEHPTYESIDHEGYPHTWQEDHVKVDITLEGAQYVLGDYIDGVLNWGKIKYKMFRTQRGYFVRGTDPETYNVTIGGNTQNISNSMLRLGQHYHNIFEYGYTNPNYVPSQGDHELTFWLDHEEEIDLFYGPESNPEAEKTEIHRYYAGTSDEWVGNPFQANNPFLFYYSYGTRVPRGMFDIRKLAYFSRKLEKYGLFRPNSPIADRTEQYTDMLVLDTNKSGEAYRKTNKASIMTFVAQWSNAAMDTWPEVINATLNRTTYIGKWPDDNHEAEVQVPGNKTIYATDTSEDWTTSWPTIPELLYGDANVCKGNGVRTDLDVVCFSVEVPDVENEGKYVVLSDHKTGGKLTALVGFGENFYPVRSC